MENRVRERESEVPRIQHARIPKWSELIFNEDLKTEWWRKNVKLYDVQLVPMFASTRIALTGVGF